METTQVAILARGAVNLPGYQCSKTATITANGQVTFVFGPSNDFSVKFSLDQWNEIVQFVESQLDAVGDKAQPSWVNWSEVPSDHNYVAGDENRKVYSYQDKPIRTPMEGMWVCGVDGSGVDILDHVTLPQSISWQKSLCVRPSMSPHRENCPCCSR